MINPGKRIKLLREEKEISQETLAHIIGCSRISIVRYEKGHSLIDTHNLIQLSLYFQVSTDYLLGLSDKKQINESGNIIMTLGEIISNSKSNLPDKNEQYYWINKTQDIIGGQTIFKGYTEDFKEIRILRAVIPEPAIHLCSEHYGPPMIINTADEAYAFTIMGGHAIIKESICKEYLPEFLEDFIVES